MSDGPTIHDKTDTFHWSADYDADRIDREFDIGDVVVGLDPQERLGEGTVAVSQIVDDARERIAQRGLFWDEREAFRYAEMLRAVDDDE